MFGIGATELVIIGVVLLIAVGPSRLPKLLKAVVSAYREFRRATRELRASTGIDEILQDEDLRDLRKPLVIPELSPTKKPLPAKPAPTKARSLTYTERLQESPPEGVDLAELRYLEARPSPEEQEAIRAAKEAKLADEQQVIAAKIAAAEAAEVEPLSDEEIAARVADKAAARQAEREAIAAKIAAADAAEVEPLSDEEIAARVADKAAARQAEREVIAAKLAAAQPPEPEPAAEDER
ncbi:MAG: twin-arginine translocase TatA/TatE family subunit [Sandaracinaceae bacterium]|nr:twin-arginine translocase TatA/TatE family subunit [Sandaracinaceae bacterium]